MRCNLWSGCRNGRESENVESGRECLHKNPDPEHIPCYRVVNFRGELSGAFAFGGKDVQKKLLEADGIEVVNGTVDLKKYGLTQRDDKR